MRKITMLAFAVCPLLATAQDDLIRKIESNQSYTNTNVITINKDKAKKEEVVQTEEGKKDKEEEKAKSRKETEPEAKLDQNPPSQPGGPEEHPEGRKLYATKHREKYHFQISCEHLWG
jgi:hypothetical protein